MYIRVGWIDKQWWRKRCLSERWGIKELLNYLVCKVPSWRRKPEREMVKERGKMGAGVRWTGHTLFQTEENAQHNLLTGLREISLIHDAFKVRMDCCYANSIMVKAVIYFPCNLLTCNFTDILEESALYLGLNNSKYLTYIAFHFLLLEIIDSFLKNYLQLCKIHLHEP